MDILDADDKPLFSKRLNKKQERDIVQFVPFRLFKNDPLKLAKETLEEVPRQFISFMSSKGIYPNIEGIDSFKAAPAGWNNGGVNFH